MMYSTKYSLILAFHGCDQSVRDAIINNKDSLKPSTNEYDWLGNGIYFWENDPKRAMEYARILQENPGRCSSVIITPAVLGAVIDLGYCLDLLNRSNLDLLEQNYRILKMGVDGNIPENKSVVEYGDLLIRELDCAVLEITHALNDKEGLPAYDSVRGVFWEGDDLYPNAGFKKLNHIQICIRNPNCIKGFFIPREYDEQYSRV